MIRRMRMITMSASVWLVIAIFCAMSGFYIGPDAAMLPFIALAVIGLTYQATRKWRFNRSLSAIGEADTRPVRFDGTIAQG